MASRSRRSSSPAPRQIQALRHRIALLGSSGGSTLRASAIEEFKALASQLSQLPACTIVAMSFVEASVPLDHAADDEPAALWTLDAAGAPVCRTHGALAAVNRSLQRIGIRRRCQCSLCRYRCHLCSRRCRCHRLIGRLTRP